MRYPKADPEATFTCQHADCESLVPALNHWCDVHKAEAMKRRAKVKADREEHDRRRAAFVAKREAYFRKCGVKT